MTDTLKFTILGCGSSGGVPRLGNMWGECDPTNPKNRRQRCSLLVERITDSGRTTVLIDSSPDMRAQLLDAQVMHMDAVVYTHEHADHTSGLDDLRQFVLRQRAQMPVYADARTQKALLDRFNYAFIQPEGSFYPAILQLNALEPITTINGAGGPISFEALNVAHGNIMANGFRINDLVYMPDVSDIPDEIWPRLMGLSHFIIDGLQRKPHKTHAHLDKTLDWIERVEPTQAVITNMHIDLDYDYVANNSPEHVRPAFDGLNIELPAS